MHGKLVNIGLVDAIAEGQILDFRANSHEFLSNYGNQSSFAKSSHFLHGQLAWSASKGRATILLYRLLNRVNTLELEYAIQNGSLDHFLSHIELVLREDKG